jgi:deazaflavin-dependent oxidoreductase (nitroreductase family)
VADFNQTIITEFRANGGHVETAGFGDSLVLLHTVGARSGAERVNPLMAIAADDGWMVVASAGGAPRHPAWFHNLIAHPAAAVEIGSGEIVDVVATQLDGADYDAAWAAFTARSRAFESYAQRAGDREIPVVRLSRA